MRTYIFVFTLLIIGIGVWWYAARSPEDVSELPLQENEAATVATSSPAVAEGESFGAPLEERTPVAFGTYSIDTSESVFGWAGKKPFIDGYVNSGTIMLQEGMFALTAENGLRGNVVLDMNTITVGLTAAKPGGESKLEEHLKGDAFFKVAEYPTATFTITDSEQTDDFHYGIVGDLTMLGTTQEIAFDAEAFATENGDTATILAQFTIDRTRWGITVGSGSFFSDLGDNLISDDILLDLLLVTRRYE